eukprot:CAMPEP_0205833994 /NCGR_PEP_ID=MMETSP0206-20130828/50441_1 /ASSEMBLY_ACC=CAM_ASM_000279 /TAXON_ID=36767 /ORGANISM="Euplotes focardii, Strain TN1" /LENGTH=239 /DNA_ID=CAMNT_0053140807 /DNA_START=1041 /DNA_END=1760 /DNA_ORIENTATION=-
MNERMRMMGHPVTPNGQMMNGMDNNGGRASAEIRQTMFPRPNSTNFQPPGQQVFKGAPQRTFIPNQGPSQPGIRPGSTNPTSIPQMLPTGMTGGPLGPASPPLQHTSSTPMMMQYDETKFTQLYMPPNMHHQPMPMSHSPMVDHEMNHMMRGNHNQSPYHPQMAQPQPSYYPQMAHGQHPQYHTPGMASPGMMHQPMPQQMHQQMPQQMSQPMPQQMSQPMGAQYRPVPQRNMGDHQNN